MSRPCDCDCHNYGLDTCDGGPVACCSVARQRHDDKKRVEKTLSKFDLTVELGRMRYPKLLSEITLILQAVRDEEREACIQAIRSRK